jgi:hypothetical protein
MAPDEKTTTTAPVVETPTPAPSPQVEPTPSLEDREKESIAAEASARSGKTGFETDKPADEQPPDPRAARRAELLAQLAALDYQATPAAEMSDKELHIAFHDALVLALGSHPSLDGIWQEIKKRALAS